MCPCLQLSHLWGLVLHLPLSFGSLFPALLEGNSLKISLGLKVILAFGYTEFGRLSHVRNLFQRANLLLVYPSSGVLFA